MYKKSIICKSILLTIILFLPSLSRAATLTVGTSGETYTTITSAITAASDGDTILVSSGTYTESIDYGTKDIIIQSVSGAASTTIIGTDTFSTVTFDHGQTSAAKLDGFTITHNSGDSGRGIYITTSSSPTITNCTISGNALTGTFIYTGAGIYIDGGSSAITNCTISGNTVTATSNGFSGGIYILSGSPVITLCTISDNTASADYVFGGGIYVSASSSATIISSTISNNIADGGSYASGGGIISSGNVTITNSSIIDNTANAGPTAYGGGISLGANPATITNCTISGNTINATNSYGGGISLGNGLISNTTTMINSILWGNTAVTGTDAYLNTGSILNLAYSNYDAAGSSLMGNGSVNVDIYSITTDPLFVGGGDYHLQVTSPCIDIGTDDTRTPTTASYDIDGDKRPSGAGIDIGSDEIVRYYTDTDYDGYGDPSDTGTLFSTDPGAGYSLDNSDCNDSDAAINPGATETADDGIDQNCSGYDLITYYQDSDNDGFGDPGVIKQVDDGTFPGGYAANSSDCDDTDIRINPYTVWYLDSDNDGYSSGDILSQCERLTGYKLFPELTSMVIDCNDADATINPGADEVAGDGIDQDCDGEDLAATATTGSGGGGGGDCFIAAASYGDKRAPSIMDSIIDFVTSFLGD